MKKLYILFLLGIIAWNPVAARMQQPDTLIVHAMDMIKTDSLQSYVQQLQDMQTRFMIAPNRREVATWIMDKFLSFGVPEVRLDSFLCYTHINNFQIYYDTTTWQYNVEARIEGLEVPDEEVVLIGHYDDFTHGSDPELFAPGADDNASGTAAAFEIARVIMEMDYAPHQTIIFLASAAEELMYYGDAGTEHYAEEAEADGRNIVMAINNDMIGWDDGSWTLDLFNHIGSPEITELAIRIITTYTSLNYDSSDPVYQVGGDIQPFLDAGYHGIYFMENYISPNYHSDEDVVDSCSIAYLTEVTKVSLGCILESDLTVGTGESYENTTDVKVYPNPTTGELNLFISGREEERMIRIMNTVGEELYRAGLSPGLHNINLKGYPPGVYLMTMQSRGNCTCMKILVAGSD